MVDPRTIGAQLRDRGFASARSSQRAAQPTPVRPSKSVAPSKQELSQRDKAFAGALAHTDIDKLQFMAQLTDEILGSRVVSPTQDFYNNQWRQGGLTNEAMMLAAAYGKVDEMFQETTLDSANKRLTRAVKGFTHEFTAAIPTDEARAEAKWANDLTKAVAEMIVGTGWAGGNRDYMKGPARAITIADISEQLGRYCNHPIALQFYKTGGLRKMTPLPPKYWVINSDENGNWIDPAEAYIQFDPATNQPVRTNHPVKKEKIVTGKIHTKNMVWATANHDPAQRYGFPFAYKAAVFVDSFRSLVEGLEEARDNANPEKVYLTPGKDGRGFSEDERDKIKNSFPDKARVRGQKLKAYDFYRLLNGVSDAKVLSIGTDFFNQFGDADMFREHIAMIYGISIALVLGKANFNRATLELLLRMESASRRLWAAHLATTLVFPIFQHVLDSANIRTDLITCELVWNEEKTPEEMSAEAVFAKECWLDDLISEESAHIKACNYLSINPKTDNERKAKEKEQGKRPPEQQRQTVRISGMNPKQPLQLPSGSNIAGAPFASQEDDEDETPLN